MFYRFILIVSIVWIVTACTTEAPLTIGALSTPVADLPINLNTNAASPALPSPVSDTLIQEADAEYTLLANIYERSTPSIVNIEADLAGGTPQNPNVSRGSGFIYDTTGHILTNAHVIQNALTIRVTFNDGYVTTATVVGADTYSDLALLRVTVERVQLIPLALMADSDQIRVGQRAIAIGNPFGLSGSMALGIISGLGRNLRSAELLDDNAPVGFQNPSIIQTDTPVNPGNSGGPLLNSNGEVMGITTAIRTDSGIFQGVGFAVPANTIRRIVPDLITNGRASYAWMGISVQPEDNGYNVAGLAEPLNLPVNQGVLLRGVTIGGPADESGLRGGVRTVQVRGQTVCIGGDIIVAINGTYIASMDELMSYLIINTRPNDRVNLLIVRDQSTFDVSLILRERPSSNASVRDCVQ
ncbi:MAG: trypsin-like peptidase domain-containing protein [Phototrophicaceae bacterium]